MNKKIIKICEEKFIYLNYSPRIKNNYLSHIKQFLKSIGDKQVIHLSARDFQTYLNNYNFSSVTLRHSSFTNLLEPVTDLRIIQKIARI